MLLDPWKESYDKPRQGVEKQRHYSVNKGLQFVRAGSQGRQKAKESMPSNCGAGEDS